MPIGGRGISCNWRCLPGRLSGVADPVVLVGDGGGAGEGGAGAGVQTLPHLTHRLQASGTSYSISTHQLETAY